MFGDKSVTLVLVVSTQQVGLWVAACALVFTVVNCTIAVLNFLMTRFPWLRIYAVLVERDGHASFNLTIFNSGAPAWGINANLVIAKGAGNPEQHTFQWPMVNDHPKPVEVLMAGQTAQLYFPYGLLSDDLQHRGVNLLKAPDVEVTIEVFIGKKLWRRIPASRIRTFVTHTVVETITFSVPKGKSEQSGSGK